VNVDPDTAEMSEMECQEAVERAGIRDPADRDSHGEGREESDVDVVVS
jgi:hypothetical protein